MSRRDQTVQMDESGAWRIKPSYAVPITMAFVQITVIVVTLGVMYGQLKGELELVKYRLTQIEHKVGIPGSANAGTSWEEWGP